MAAYHYLFFATSKHSAFRFSMHSRMGGASWMKKFVPKLLDMSHSQWLFRNFSLHNKVKGHLHLSHQAEVLAEIAILATKRPEDIPVESKFLLELEVVDLDRSSLSQQEYWVAAMRAALVAGRRRCRPHRSKHGSSECTGPWFLLASCHSR